MNKIFMKIRTYIKSFYFDLINPLGFKIKQNKLTYLSSGALYNIHSYITTIEKNQIQGVFIETGCALGGSTIQIGSVKNKKRRLLVFDVFGKIPAPSDIDGDDVLARYVNIEDGNSKGIGGNTYYGYEENLINKVRHNLKEFGLTEEDNIG